MVQVGCRGLQGGVAAAAISTPQCTVWGSGRDGGWSTCRGCGWWLVSPTWFFRMPSFKIESSGYWSKKNWDSILKVSIGTGKKSWQKTPPGPPLTGQTIQVMGRMDSTSTEAMKALSRFQKKNSDGEAKPQNSIFGPDCNQNCCCTCLTSPLAFPQKLKHDEALMRIYPYLLPLRLRTQSTFLTVLSFAMEDFVYCDCTVYHWENKYIA